MINTNVSPQNTKINTKISNDVFARYRTDEVTSKRPMSVTINKNPQEVAAVLSDLQNLPLFLENLEEIQSVVDGRATWRFRSELENSYTMDIPMNLEFGTIENGFVWESQDKAGFKYSVAIQLEPAVPANRGTVVRMMVMYDSIAGDLVGLFEKLFGSDAEILSKKNLQRLRAFCEVGHVPTTAGQPSGRDEDQHHSIKH